jgi:hypothetical protein
MASGWGCKSCLSRSRRRWPVFASMPFAVPHTCSNSMPIPILKFPNPLMYKSHCVEVCRPFRTWGRDSPGCEGINPFAGVCRRLRGLGGLRHLLVGISPPTCLPLGWAQSPPDLSGLILKSSHLPILKSSNLPISIPTCRDHPTSPLSTECRSASLCHPDRKG